MDSARVVTAICRVAAVLAVAGVVAMHVLTTGHHADLPVVGGADGAVSASSHSAGPGHVLSDIVTGGTVTTALSGPTSTQDLVGVCMAVLVVAATTLLLLLARTRRRPWPTDPTSRLARWGLHVPSPRPPSLFTLGVLRT